MDKAKTNNFFLKPTYLPTYVTVVMVVTVVTAVTVVTGVTVVTKNVFRNSETEIVTVQNTQLGQNSKIQIVTKLYKKKN